MFCQVAVPAAWQAVLDRGIVDVPESHLVPFGVSGDAQSVFAALYSPEWSGVAMVSARTGEYTRIFPFASPSDDQVGGGGFDGRWLAWAEQHSKRDLNDWTLRAWDSRSRQVVTVTEAPRKDGRTVSGPIVIPAVSHGMLAWVQATPNGDGEAHLYSLAHRRDQVLSSGRVLTPITFWWPYVIWQERDGTDSVGPSGHLEMAEATTGRRVELPEALATVHHLAYLAASDSLVTWTDMVSLWIWRPGEPAAREVFHAPSGEYIQFPAIARDMIVWDGVMGPWVADVRSGSVAKIPQQYGGLFARDSALLVVAPTSLAKTARPSLRIRVADATRLPPLPGCAGDRQTPAEVP